MTTTPTPLTLPVSVRRSPGHRIVSLAAAVLVLAATGCAAAPRQSASAPAAAMPPESPEEKSKVEAAAPASAPADDASTRVAPSTVAPAGEGRDSSGASGEFERAARTIDAAPSDCRQACRALGSMDRACGQLCQLDSDQTCNDDKARLRSARRRVRTSCGSCADGTSVEPDGPIPQRR